MADFQIGMQIDAEHMQNIFGENDAYIKKIEDDLKVIITDRNGEVKITGEESAVNRAVKLVKELVELSKRGNTIQEQNVMYGLELSRDGDDDALLEIDSECICHTISGNATSQLGPLPQVKPQTPQGITQGIPPSRR